MIKAIQSLHAILEAGRRTTGAIRSMRPTAVMEPGGVTRFNLNDLVRATASLLERELAVEDISLDLRLDDTLPTILADRTKLQWVLVNLLANAIESLGATRGRPRRIAIRTSAPDALDVLIEVSDNGAGIASGQMERIFDPFVTTKPARAGLGLPLSRAIISAHGGRLWASPGEPHGAVLHIQLPGSALLTTSNPADYSGA